MSKSKKKVTIENIPSNPNVAVPLDEEPEQAPGVFESLEAAALVPAEVALEQFEEERKKLEPIKARAAALLSELKPLQREHAPFLRQVGEMNTRALLRAGAPRNIIDEIENLHGEIRSSLAAYIRQAEQVGPALDALTPTDLLPHNRSRAIYVASHFGTTGIESGSQALRERLARLRNAVDRLERFMQTKPKPVVSIRILPVTRSHEPATQETDRQRFAETN